MMKRAHTLDTGHQGLNQQQLSQYQNPQQSWKPSFFQVNGPEISSQPDETGLYERNQLIEAT